MKGGLNDSNKNQKVIVNFKFKVRFLFITIKNTSKNTNYTINQLF